MKKIIYLLFILITSLNLEVNACTVVRIAANGKIYVGSNEDWKETKTKIWFRPSTDTEYGRVCFGHKKEFGFVEGGMNERGLTLDALATSQTGYKPNPNRSTFKGQVNDYILASFKTIEEVKQYFLTYNVPLVNGEFMIADSTGASMIVEYVEGDYRFIQSDKYYQIATNFVQYGLEEDEYTDRRYNIARKILEENNDASLEIMKKTLSAVHQEWFSPTTYSYICDLKSKTVYVYNFHNYEEEYVIDLKEELKEGKHYYDLPSLFKVTTEAAYSFQEIVPKDGSKKIEELINSEGIHKVNTWFEEAKDKVITSPVYSFDENKINTLGYKYLSNKQYDEALAVFKINTKKNPESWNVWDSLAETYMEMGDRENAIKYYKKSLELNPKNNNAIKRLDILKQAGLTLSQYIEKFKNDLDLVSISVALVRDKEVIWKGAFGKADVDNNIDVTTSSLYPLGSVSKLFTGVSLLKLYEEGKIDLDDDVNNYLPFSVRNPKYPNTPITIRMLLTHSSSIGDYQELQYKLYHHGDPKMSLAEVNEKFFNINGEYYRDENYLNFEPGTSWEYSNWNFALIGFIIERITDKPFNEYNKEVVLGPLEMINSGWLTTEFDTTNCIMMYEKMDDGNLMRLDNLSTWPGYSDGSLKSNIEEACNFLMMMINKGKFKDKQILKSSTIDEMLKPQGIKNLPEGYLKDMGLVWHIGSIINNQYFHTGEPRGSLMAMVFSPETNSGFVSFITGVKFGDKEDLNKWVNYLQYLSEQSATYKN